MPAQPDFQTLQQRFAGHIRNPEVEPIPDAIEARRMDIYTGLFFRNIEGFVSGAFPVLRSLYSEAAWLGLVREFIRDYRCKSPYFLQVSEEFLAFLGQRLAKANDPAFIVELAHYEWVELALDVADIEPDWEQIDPNGDLLEGIPVVSPVAWPLHYQYPVHQLGPAYQPTEPPAEASFLIVYRNREDKVKFIASNAVTVSLLSRLSAEQGQSNFTGREQLLAMADEMSHPDPENLVIAGHGMLQKLQAQGVILGTIKA